MLHQNGYEQTALRINELALTIATGFAGKVKERRPAPDS